MLQVSLCQLCRSLASGPISAVEQASTLLHHDLEDSLTYLSQNFFSIWKAVINLGCTKSFSLKCLLLAQRLAKQVFSMPWSWKDLQAELKLETLVSLNYF